MKKTKPLFQNTGFDNTAKKIQLGHWILWTIFIFFSLFIVWSYFAAIDEVTKANGKVVPSQKIQVIQSLDGGIVNDIPIHEGDKVHKGQVLMQIDSTRFASSFKEAKVKVIVLNLRAARLKALVEEKSFSPAPELQKQYPDLVSNELLFYQSKLQEMAQAKDILENQKTQKEQELRELQAKAQKLSDSHQYVLKELRLTQPLVNEGAVSEVEVLRLQRSVNDLAGELKETQLAIPRVQSALSEADNKLKEQKSNQQSLLLKELSEVHAELSTLRESNVALEDRVNRTAVQSPVNGTVNKLNVNTVGGVVSPGMDLIEIVPADDSLLVEAKVKPADIAFLRPGQTGLVKVSAYDFSIYGGLQGKLERIGADTITEKEGESYYQITVRTTKNYIEKNGKRHDIMPGMVVTVDIVTGRKTILQYLLKPIIKARYDALRER